jgi:hypothetical protein
MLTFKVSRFAAKATHSRPLEEMADGLVPEMGGPGLVTPALHTWGANMRTTHETKLHKGHSGWEARTEVVPPLTVDAIAEHDRTRPSSAP